MAASPGLAVRPRSTVEVARWLTGEAGIESGGGTGVAWRGRARRDGPSNRLGMGLAAGAAGW